MRFRLLRNINRLFIINLMISIFFYTYAEPAKDLPFHIEKTVEKEMTYDYAFKEVWNAALMTLQSEENNRLNEMQKKGLESFKTDIRSDKSSGLITFTITHKGKKGLFSATVLSQFSYQVLLVEPLENQRTRIYHHEINFLSYGSYVFNDKQYARRLIFTPSGINILEEIYSRLKERAIDKQ